MSTRTHGQPRPGQAADDRPTGTERCLVVGYDGGEPSRRAINWAASQLAPNGKLVLVYACRPLHGPAFALSVERERRELGKALVDELLLDSDDALLDTLVHTELSDTDPVSALASAAAKHEAEAIVVGHEPHSRLCTVIGTVTSALLAQAQTPVTVVPSPSLSNRRDGRPLTVAVGSRHARGGKPATKGR